jgi:hypothetical protein
MAKQQLYKNHGIITIKYEKNYNNKFYSKYFASIRGIDFKVMENSIYEIEVNGKIIGSAKLMIIEHHKFCEIGQFFISTITGMNYADSLEHYYKKGLNVKSFDLEVKVLMFEMLSYAPKQIA